MLNIEMLKFLFDNHNLLIVMFINRFRCPHRLVQNDAAQIMIADKFSLENSYFFVCYLHDGFLCF